MKRKKNSLNGNFKNKKGWFFLKKGIYIYIYIFRQSYSYCPKVIHGKPGLFTEVHIYWHKFESRKKTLQE